MKCEGIFSPFSFEVSMTKFDNFLKLDVFPLELIILGIYFFPY